MLDSLIKLAGKRQDNAPQADKPAPPAAAPTDPYGMATMAKTTYNPASLRERGCAKPTSEALAQRNGLKIYEWFTVHPGLVSAAIRATGTSASGDPVPAKERSDTCLWANNLSGDGSIRWTIFYGVTTPILPVLDEQSERSVNVVDLECLAKAGTSIPTTWKVLTVHDYLDDVLRQRVSRARKAGYAPYADKLLSEYLDVKNGRDW